MHGAECMKNLESFLDLEEVLKGAENYARIWFSSS